MTTVMQIFSPGNRNVMIDAVSERKDSVVVSEIGDIQKTIPETQWTTDVTDPAIILSL